MHVLRVFFFTALGLGLLSGCNTPVEPPADSEKTAPMMSQAGDMRASQSVDEVSTSGARVNVPGCQNDDGTTDILLPNGDFRFGVPITASNCVLDAGPTEHLIVHSELPDDVAAPDRPVVWNYENTQLPCWANNEDPKYTTDWEQRITPSGEVHLTCHFNATKNSSS